MLIESRPPPPPKIDFDLPPEWITEDPDDVPAKNIDELKQKLAPHVDLVLKEWIPDALIRVAGDYVFVGDEESGFKVSRTTGVAWPDHHGHYNKPWGDILNLFQEYSGIEDDKRAFHTLDTIRLRIERTTPEILAEKARAREKRKREAQKEFLSELKREIWRYVTESGSMTPPPAGPKKRAKKTARAFWEWIFLPDAPVTADHIKKAFEYWEKTGHDLYFRVESKVYPKMTNWVLTATGKTPVTKLVEQFKT